MRGALIDRTVRPLAAATVAAGLLVAACTDGAQVDGNDQGAAIPVEVQRGLVLQPADLPRVFVRFDEGELARSELQAGPREDPDRFGRLGGWKARYRRPGTRATRGPLVVESMVDVFRTGDGAARDLEAYRTQFSDGVATTLDPPRLGDGAVAVTILQGQGRFATRFFMIAWRQHNVTAFVSANGFEGKMSLKDALALAEKQSRRLQAAAREPTR